MKLKDKNTKFTSETEDSNNFSFLDVKIIRKSKQFATSSFQKATLSGIFTDYDSFIFNTYKIGLVQTPLFWFFRICSIMEKFYMEVEYLTSILKCSNYPANIIDQCIKILLDKLYPLYLRRHLIYKFQCSNFNIIYYGKTEPHLKVRAVEHISTSPFTVKMVHNNKQSSVKNHCFLSGHVRLFVDFTVLNYESHKFKRLIKESLLVTKDKSLLNKQVK